MNSLSTRDRHAVGKDADNIYSQLRKDLALALHLAIRDQEAQPTTDLWFDSSEQLFALVESVIQHANGLKDLSLEGEAMLLKEVYDSLQTRH